MPGRFCWLRFSAQNCGESRRSHESKAVHSSSVQLPIVSVGVLHVDEQSLAECLTTIDNQEQVVVRRALFSGFPQQQSHELLYAFLNRQRRHASARAKVDADMVLYSNRIFSASVATFEAFNELDRITFPLYDNLLGREIYGLHVWSPRVRWSSSSSPSLRTDMRPENVRRVLFIPRGGKQRFGVHAPRRTSLDATMFVARRAAKVAERGRKSEHLPTLQATIENCHILKWKFRCEIFGALVLTSADPSRAVLALQDPLRRLRWHEEALLVGESASVADAQGALICLASRSTRFDSSWKKSLVIARKLALRRGRLKRDISGTNRGQAAIAEVLQRAFDA